MLVGLHQIPMGGLTANLSERHPETPRHERYSFVAPCPPRAPNPHYTVCYTVGFG
jgi:hypothetical protein